MSFFSQEYLIHGKQYAGLVSKTIPRLWKTIILENINIKSNLIVGFNE